MNKSISYFVSDLDGTLLIDHTDISKEDIQAINAWTEKGNQFWIATGRGTDELEWIQKKYHLTIQYMICSNGAQIIDKDKVVTSLSVIPEKFIKPIIQLLLNDYGNVFWGLETVGSDKIPIHHSDSYGSTYLMGENTMTIDQYLSQKTATDLNRVFLGIPDNQMIRLKTDIFNKFGDELQVIKTDIDCADISCKGCNKVSGVKQLCKIEGISANELAAIGDQENDLEMLRFVSRSFAMDSSAKNIQSECNETVHSVAEAIWKCLEVSTR